MKSADLPASLSLRQLQIFEMAVAAGSAGAAARALGLSQPAVTHALARLEALSGHVLLERGPGGTAPTPAGLILYRRVVRLRAQIAAAFAAARGPNALSPGASGARDGGAMTAAQLRCHIAIAEHGAFGEAARVLGISLPALHRTARGFELLAGVPLYRRQLRRIGVTPAGAALARHLRVAITELAQAREEIEAAAGQGGGRIVAGCLPLMPKKLLARVCNAALARHPGLRIALIEDSYDPLLRVLRHGEVDLVIGALRQEAAADLMAVPLFDDPYVVVGRAQHPLAGKRAPAAGALRRRGWVAAPPGTPRRAALDRLFAGGPAARVVLETNSVTMMLAALVQSDALTVTARSLVGAGTARLAVLRLAGSETARRVGYTIRAGWLPTTAQAGFVACLEQLAAADP